MTAYEKTLDVVVERVTVPARLPRPRFYNPIGIVLASVLSAPEKIEHRTEPQTVRITESVIETDDATIPIALIAQAYVQAHEGRRPTVRLVDRFGAPLFEAVVDNEREGDDFLRALDRDLHHPRETWKILGPGGGAGVTRIGLFLVSFLASFALSAGLEAIGVANPIGEIVSTLLFFGSFAIATRTAQVDMGADGLLYRWLWTTRFVPWNEVTNVEYGSGDAVHVQVKGRRTLRLEDPTARSPRTAETRSLVHASLRSRVVEAWQAHRIRAGNTAMLDQLARGGRDVGAWRAVLASLRSADTGYRAGATRDADLWRVVENAAAPEDARAAAALALRTAEDAPVRLRVAAEAVVSPGLRIALETAADREAEDAALDEALERVSARE